MSVYKSKVNTASWEDGPSAKYWRIKVFLPNGKTLYYFSEQEPIWTNKEKSHIEFTDVEVNTGRTRKVSVRLSPESDVLIQAPLQ